MSTRAELIWGFFNRRNELCQYMVLVPEHGCKRTSSAVPHISSNEGELRGKNPNLCNLNIKFCSRCLWPILAYPHHAGDAYHSGQCGSAGDVLKGISSKTV